MSYHGWFARPAAWAIGCSEFSRPESALHYKRDDALSDLVTPFMRRPRSRFAGGLVGVLLVLCLYCLHVQANFPEDPPPRAAAELAASAETLLAARCLECHNTHDHEGGLSLDSRQGLTAGGDSGPAFNQDEPAKSLILARVQADEMPPEHPLTSQEKELLARWVAAGAVYPSSVINRFAYTTSARAGFDWWSLRPLQTTDLQSLPQGDFVKNPIDRFVLQKLQEKGLSPSPPADRLTLCRRLCFDLTGLPPTPEMLQQFERDIAPGSVDRLITRLLNSPHYGERFARHWLDVARFGESQGFERDKLRPVSWPYRDWVIWALNSDLPYDEFVRLQVAGDVLRPDDPMAVIATGFLVAGPWDEVGQSQQSAPMKAVVRADELEDLVSATCQVFLGLTAQCARCHDHKFDPITRTDYYRISAALDGVRHGERETPPGQGLTQLAERKAAIEAEIAGLQSQVDELLAAERALLEAQWAANPAPAPVPMANWEFDGDLKDSIGSLHGTASGGAELENGQLVLNGTTAYVTTVPLPKPLSEKTLSVWVRLNGLDQQGGAAISVQSADGGLFDAIVFGERQSRRWVPGSDGFNRTKDVVGAEESEADSQYIHMAIVYAADQSIQAYRQGVPYGEAYQASSVQSFAAGEAHVAFGVRHFPIGPGKMLAGRIERAQLFDRALSSEEVARLAERPPTVTLADLLPKLSGQERDRCLSMMLRLSQLQAETRLLSPGRAYAVSPKPPGITRVQLRGNPAQLAEEVAPGGIAGLQFSLGPSASIAQGSESAHEWGLSTDSPDADRRKALAAWLTDERNVLASRVIVNRVWHWHFGQGLVDTPNDFGFNGGRPSHPELLDWLAQDFLDHGRSLKHLHRVILQSATYQQASTPVPEGLAADAQCRWLWRKPPRRLEAEAIRDSILFAAGELNPSMGGPGFQDFKTFTNNSQFYEVIDSPGIAMQRMSIYRTWIRSGTHPFLDAFDCPDPSTIAARRAVTNTPLAALALWNHGLVLRMADRLAQNISQEAGTDPAQQVTAAYLRVLSRPPNQAEREAAASFVSSHGLPALCRVLLNSNEMIYVE